MGENLVAHTTWQGKLDSLVQFHLGNETLEAIFWRQCVYGEEANEEIWDKE